MGAWPYQYVIPYNDDVKAALEALRKDVFERGEYYGSEARPRTIKEAIKRAGDSGTRSILDIERISETPDNFCAAPLSAEEERRYFGGQTPTVKMVEESEPLWEELERGTARYVTIYENGVPAKLMFVGYSID